MNKEEGIFLVGIAAVVGAFLIFSKPSYGNPVITGATLDANGTLRVYGTGLNSVGIYIDGTSDLVLYSGNPIVIHNVVNTAQTVYAINYLGIRSNTVTIAHI